MKSKNDLLYQASLNHKIVPSENVWLKLDAKLEKNRNIRKLKKYKSIAIAAILVAVIGVMSGIVIQKSNFMDVNDTTQSYSLQTLDFKSDGDAGLYEVAKLRNLKLAYNKNSVKRKM